MLCKLCFHHYSGGGLLTKPCLTLAAPWAVARQAPLSMEFSRQDYWNGLQFPSPGDLPKPGVKPTSPHLVTLFYRGRNRASVSLSDQTNRMQN